MIIKTEATAFILEESTMNTIVEKTGIERKVLEDWLLYDQGFNLQTKVIVVEITKDTEGEGNGH